MNNNFRYNEGYWGKVIKLCPDVEEKPIDLQIKEKFEQFPDSWFSGSSLAMEFHCNKLTIRKKIQLLRECGMAIISDIKKGYMLTTDKVLLEQYVFSRQKEICKELNTLNKMKV